MNEVEKLAEVLRERFSHIVIREDYGWPNPPLNVLDCVLSLNRRYDAFVVPRVKAFAKRHPEVIELGQLLELVDSYGSPLRFSMEELNYRDADRAETLRGVIEYLIRVQHEYEGDTEVDRLQGWAVSVSPSDSVSVGVGGFGLSGFQYLRMLFGAQAAKPDVHIKRFVSKVIGRRVGDRMALELLEQAAARAGLPLRAVDGAIWEDQSGKGATA